MATIPEIRSAAPSYLEERPVHISSACGELGGSLGLVAGATGMVLIANDRGTARHRTSELLLARALRQRGLATLMVDVLTLEEQADVVRAARLRVDAIKLAHRIAEARAWLAGQERLRGLPLAVVGEGGAGAAAIVEASARREGLAAVVLRAGQPMQAGAALEACETPVLLVVDARDRALLAQNRAAVVELPGEAQLLAAASLCAADDAACDDAAVTESIASWLEVHLARVAVPARAARSLAAEGAALAR